MKVSNRTGAIYAALLTGDKRGWSIQESIGFDKEKMPGISITPQDLLYKRYLKEKNIVLVDLEETELDVSGFVSRKDQTYVKTAIFVPVMYQEQEAFLYLAMKDKVFDADRIANRLIELDTGKQLHWESH
jgi:hypothetical protein